jgi:hypothetical protein
VDWISLDINSMEKVNNLLSVRLAIKRALGLFLIFAATTPASGAIAIDQVESTDKSSSASSITSPSFSTTAANELLLAFVSADAKSAGITVTGVTGASLTWALVQRTNVQMGTAEIWRAFAPSTLSSVSVKASLSQSVPASITVVSFTGVDTSGTNGSGAIGATGTGNANPGAPTASLVTTRNGSWVFEVGNDWDEAISRTLGPNQTMVHQYLATVGDTYWVQRQNAPTPSSGTTITINDTAPTTDRYNLSVVEVLPVLSNTTFTVTGTGSPTSLVSGATVALSQSGTTIATTTIGSNGSYTFSNIANGTYTVTPTDSGVNFTPPSQSVTVNRANATVAAFTATAQTWTVLGSITPATIAVGATVTLSQSGTTISTSAVDSNGNYSFSNVVNGIYTVTPTVSGVSFSPTSQNVSVNNGDATVPAFTATTQVSDLTIFKTHSGSFTQGQTGASYTITATNSGGAATSGTVTVTDTLPAGLTATAMSGTNWACTLSTVTCTRNDPLAAGASHPAITLKVNVASNAPASVTNTATVSGGGETNTSNDTANDHATITPYGTLAHVGGGSAHPVVTNQVMTFNYTPVGTNNALVILIGCRSPGVTSMSLTAPGWAFTPISGLVGPSGYYDFISTFGAITPNTAPVTFTVTLTGGNGNCSSNDTTVLADEFSGNDPTGGTTTFDAHNESFDYGVIGICTGAPVTPANNNDAVWYGCFDNVTGVSGGYTKGQDDATGDWTEYKILSGGMNVVQNQGFVTNPNFFSFGLGGISIKPAGGTLFTVTGTASPTSLVSGASAVLSQNGTTVASTTIGSNGSYTFPSVANGTYTVTPTQSGVIFSPTSQLVTVNNGNAMVPAFTATASGITLVQKNVSGNESTNTSISANFLSNNTAGNFLIVTGTAARPAGALSISDTLGNMYIPAMGPVTDTNQNVTAYIWYVPSCKGGANTVTLTPAIAAALEVHISEWTGLATPSPVDQTASANGTGTPVSSGVATTTVNGELIFGYTFLYNTATAGAGFTPLSLVNGDLDEYQVQSTAGSIAATFTQTSGTWFALMATFKPAGSTGTTYSISGAVSPAAAGYNLALSGTTTGNTTTNSSGSYSFNALGNGSYTVTPGEAGFSFTPASQNVTVSGNSVPGINFTAQSTSTTSPLAIDVNVSKDNGTAVSSITSPAFSTSSANELLLALVATDSLSSTMTVTGVTGAGLTWSLVRRTNAQGGTSEIWRAFAPTALSSVSVTASLSQSVVSSMTVVSFSGVDRTGPIGATGSGSAASGAPTASLTTTRNNSWVVGVGNDYTNAIARTVPSSQTLIHQDLAPVGDTYWMQRQNAATPTSGTLVTINDTAPTGDQYNLAIVEVLPAQTALYSLQTWSLSGNLSPASNGAGTTLTLGGSSSTAVTADASGYYTFSGLTNGIYSVTPGKNGYNFIPTVQSAMISGANVAGVNFTVSATPPPTVAVSISPTSPLLSTGGTQQFAASVTGTTNTAVTWSATGGTVSSGLYTAPGTAGSYMVTATSVADNTKSASAIVSVTVPGSSTMLLGDPSVEGQPDSSLPLGQAEAFQTMANASGSVQSLAFYLDSTSTVSQVVTGLYADTGGHPGTLLSQGKTTQLVAGAWNPIPLPATNVVAGTPFWIAIMGTSSGTMVFRDAAAGICSSETNAQSSLTALPSTWTTGTVFSTCPVSAFGDSSKVVFFDTFAGTTLSPNWKVISRHGQYSQHETECNIPQLVSVANGLTITTAAQSWICGDFNPNGIVWHTPAIWPYITGDIQWTSLNFTYGTVEIRAKFPAQDTSLWPATWLLGSNCQSTNPLTGETGVGTCTNLGTSGYTEIDMTECYGSGWCQFHVANPGFGIGNGCDATYAVDTSFHTFKTVWNSSGITQYMDGVAVSNCNQKMSNPMFLLIQTQTGGMGGSPNNALLPAEFVVNYVKVTQP